MLPNSIGIATVTMETKETWQNKIKQAVLVSFLFLWWKHHDQTPYKKQKEFIWAYGSKEMGAHHGAKAWQQEQEAEGSHFQIQTQSSEREL